MPTFEPSHLELYFWEALAIIVLACIFVPLSRKLGLGTIIGYLLSGVAATLALSLSFEAHPEELLHFAEFGVVLFLFVIGLEFRPTELWELRGTIFGRGLVQVLMCGAVLSVPPLLFGLNWQASLIIGLGLALSSTALVMQALEEAGDRNSEHGQSAISVLIFEDLAIVPLLLLVAFLAPTQGAGTTMGQNLASIGWAIGMIVFLILAGRFLLNPMFTILARTGVQEVMTAGALGVVIAGAMLMDLVGLSYAMGSFIAGVMLASSRFRHEVEADIEPFRGLFLGLFFIAVGLSLNLSVVAENWLIILCAVPLLMALKATAIYATGRIFKTDHAAASRTALALSQHGEFGYVLFAAAASASLFDVAVGSILVSIVTLSMAASSIVDKVMSRRTPAARHLDEDFAGAGCDTLLIGFGRFGQLTAQPLLAAGMQLTILDNNADRVEEARSFGSNVHFGDGRRRDILRAAGATKARIAIVATDDPKHTNEIVALLRRDFAHLRLFVRVFDRLHAITLGPVDGCVRETQASAFEMSRLVLQGHGLPESEIESIITATKDADEKRLVAQTAKAPKDPSRADLLATIKPEPMSETSGAPNT
ncbi:MAG: cation:proton antiporter [Paracoccaceae bacterium]|nr:cation:proton antiporter [Paracoccaceae bacterium]